MSATARGRSAQARRSPPLETPRPSAPSTSWKQSFRALRPVKDLGRCAAARRAVLDRTERPEKEALQEVDGALYDWLEKLRRLKALPHPEPPAQQASRRMLRGSPASSRALEPSFEAAARRLRTRGRRAAA
jgi:hypothetical protein